MSKYLYFPFSKRKSVFRVSKNIFNLLNSSTLTRLYNENKIYDYCEGPYKFYLIHELEELYNINQKKVSRCIELCNFEFLLKNLLIHPNETMHKICRGPNYNKDKIYVNLITFILNKLQTEKEPITNNHTRQCLLWLSNIVSHIFNIEYNREYFDLFKLILLFYQKQSLLEQFDFTKFRKAFGKANSCYIYYLLYNFGGYLYIDGDDVENIVTHLDFDTAEGSELLKLLESKYKFKPSFQCLVNIAKYNKSVGASLYLKPYISSAKARPNGIFYYPNIFSLCTEYQIEGVYYPSIFSLCMEYCSIYIFKLFLTNKFRDVILSTINIFLQKTIFNIHDRIRKIRLMFDLFDKEYLFNTFSTLIIVYLSSLSKFDKYCNKNVTTIENFKFFIDYFYKPNTITQTLTLQIYLESLYEKYNYIVSIFPKGKIYYDKIKYWAENHNTLIYKCMVLIKREIKLNPHYGAAAKNFNFKQCQIDLKLVSLKLNINIVKNEI
jgi:hypothetical protein